MYSIGQLSKKTGVTVRTLDHYDEIGLIKPSSKTDGGHRLYNEDDVMRLERVLALKFMGFKLEQIKNILKDSTSTWLESIQEQLEMVKREQERLKTLEQALLGISCSIEYEGEVNWSIIFSTIQLFQQDPEDVLQQYKSYLSEDEMEKIMDMNAQMSKEDMREWMEIISDIKANLEIDPASEKAQQLAERWMNLAENIFGNDEELLGDMWDALQNLKEGIVFYPMDKDVIEFIERVYMAKEEVK
ncbi:MerR family transcriptional regulator [Tenuibacillus multivorans]|uniref:DNA-binding transcriptional regulator, MerR family n=1 Tax=Tenuibacillus multivorans TaxID=237069 RepID=A0A1G9WA65_9BACI|nr:MerR family transcriptional regulator [Tenuibacillus multivorans]GEL76364.1 MerR family transcriptional regulator [Tenuibacillus multivorans]SDM81187.1 DNA-binding transcriptional regulator, MerR family [Tenuibacillus multivorans]